MEAGELVDAYGSYLERDMQQADAEQAYILANLVGEETWVELLEVAWRGTEFENIVVNNDASHKFTRPSAFTEGVLRTPCRWHLLGKMLRWPRHLSRLRANPRLALMLLSYYV